MKFILFGAGDVGIRALHIIGDEHVICFADNHKCGTVIQGKKVISFEQMKEKEQDTIIVISSDNYIAEMEKQLHQEGLSDYLIFNRRYDQKMNEYLPKYNYLYNTQFMNYTDILLNYKISEYRNIAIVGVNKYLKELIFEIAILSNLRIVKFIVGEEGVSDYYGIPNKKLSDLNDEIDCVIINSPRTETNVREDDRLKGKRIIDIYDVDKFIYYNQHPELNKYKDIHKGKRVFIVGNGPSVRLEDLETLHDNNEICFGLNKIHKVFSEVKWRPDYICMTDSRVIISCEEKIEQMTEESELIVGDRYVYLDVAHAEKVNYVHLKSEYYMPNFPGFSNDITKGVYWGYSVTYDIALQFAAYMGASEIYLIGIDNNNVGAVTDKRNHFIKDYFEEEEQNTYRNVIANFDAMTVAYQKAEQYSREHGFRIFNATRGGKLEVFERVEFDKLFARKLK